MALTEFHRFSHVSVNNGDRRTPSRVISKQGIKHEQMNGHAHQHPDSESVNALNKAAENVANVPIVLFIGNLIQTLSNLLC